MEDYPQNQLELQNSRQLGFAMVRPRVGRPEKVFRAVLDEGVIVQMDSGRVIVVNTVDLFLLPILKKPVRCEELIAALVNSFVFDIGRFARERGYLEQLTAV